MLFLLEYYRISSNSSRANINFKPQYEVIIQGGGGGGGATAIEKILDFYP